MNIQDLGAAMYWIQELERMRNKLSPAPDNRLPLFIWDEYTVFEKKQKNDRDRAKSSTNIVIIDMNGE